MEKGDIIIDGGNSEYQDTNVSSRHPFYLGDLSLVSYSELKRDRDLEYSLTVYFVEPSHCNLCGNLIGTGNLVNGLPSHLHITL